MTMNHPNRAPFSARKIFTRPANLHLVRSNGKGPSTLAPVDTASEEPHSKMEDLKPHFAQPPIQTIAPWTSLNASRQETTPHPYSSFSLSGESAWASSPCSSVMSRQLSARFSTARTSSKTVLKAGELTWAHAGSGPKRIASGFEWSRRRQRLHEPVGGPSQTVFAVLERHNLESPRRESYAARADEYGSLQRTPSSIPYLASPGACDPSPFDNNELKSLVPPPVPLCLDDLSRWTPPSEWAVSESGSSSQDSNGRSSTSSSSDHLSTPKSSPGTRRDQQETYLNFYSRRFDPSRSVSGRQLMQLLITSDSTVEIKQYQTEVSDPGSSEHPIQWQIIVTGHSTAQRSSSEFYSTSTFANSDSTEFWTVCTLTSPNVAELRSWLDCLESVIQACRKLSSSSSSRSEYRRSSSHSILATIRLLEQLELQSRCERGMHRSPSSKVDGEEPTTPVVSSRYLSPTAARGSTTAPDFSSGFSTSSFIDSYALSPASAGADVAVQNTSGMEALYDYEEAYSSIMQRFSEYEIASPMEALPTPARLDPHRGHARSACLDVPVSPCSFEIGRDRWVEYEGVPGSPLDPWLSQHISLPVSGRKMREEDGFGDDAVMRIFAEGFRRRSSAATTNSIILSAET
ncbi:hypothetical protein PaG_01912 [Moesziomyces aphidis]|uniref:Uncharacterized protein n=1 Tax=Moesziomyces aphidis TaxID=84754 RepID=W3VPJ7_MOEAP|nr:hypothetical protein PaG_01912 [Moesziomyces aphidis]